MTTDNIFDNDILNGDLTNSLVPELGQEDILIDVTPQESSFADPLTQELSLVEQEVAVDEIERDNNSISNNTSSFDNIAIANIDPLTAANPEEFQVNEIDVNDTSFAPPQSELELLGGFGDVDGGDDVTLEIEDNAGNVIETYKLTGEGQATLYRDQEYQYVFFSGVDETTNVDISSVSNIKFGNYIGDSLKIETTGSIDGGDIVLNDENTEVDSGLTLRAGIDTENSVGSEFDGYTLVDFGTNREMVDINYYGQIVGNDDYSGTEEFFFYDGQYVYTLPGYHSSRAFGINDYGQMVGEGLPTADDTKYRPLIAYSNGSVQEIQYVEGGGRYDADPNADEVYTYEAYGSVRDVNNYLELASYQLNVPPENAPEELGLTPFEDSYFLSPDGTQSVNIGYELLDSEKSRAFGINNPGSVVGINRETNRAFVFNRENNLVTNLGTLPGDNYSAAYAINDVGQVVGVSTSDSGSRAFIYENGTMKDMKVSYVGDPESRVGIDINNLGQAVVTSAEGIPFVYQNGVATNLNDWLRPEVMDLGYTVTEAKGINDRGQIIAQGTLEDSERGFLLNPTFQAVNRNINVGNISTFGETVLLEGAEVYLEGKSIVTQGGEITVDGATKVSSNLTINSSVTEDEVIIDGGDITFIGTLDGVSAGSNNLRLQAGTGNLFFSETVGGEATLRNINVLGADIVTANADITSDQLVKINATGSVAAGSIDTEGSYVAIEAALDIIASAIEANGGGVDLVANSDFGGATLTASGGVNDAVDSLNELIISQQEFISEIVNDLIYHRRDIAEFILGVLYETAANNLEDAFNIGQFILPYKLTERDKRYWNQIIQGQSDAFQLGRELADAASIIQGMIELFTGGAAIASASSLCLAGAGATLGASCFAAAPAIASGAALSAHGLSLIKNGLENDTDANLIDDLLAPQNMASTGGSNAAKGLAQKIGASPDRVDNALEVLGSKKIEQLKGRLNFTETRFRRDTSGQPVETKQDVKLLNRVLDKSKELVYNISKAFDLVDDKARGINDVDGINDIRATIKQNRDRGEKPQLINDTELNTALTENNNFIKQYQGRASGAFANRFGKANSAELNNIQARGELNAAKDILDGNTPLGNDVKLRGLPETTNTQTNPEYLASMPDGSTRLVEVKTLKDNFNQRKIRTNLIDATDQIAGNTSTTPTTKGYVRLDFRNTTSISQQPNWWVDRISSALVDTRRKGGTTTTTPGIEIVEFVEVLYKDPQNQVQKLLMRVNNGVVGLM